MNAHLMIPQKRKKQSVDSVYLVGHTSDEVAPSTSSTVWKSVTLNAKTIVITISKTIETTAVPNCTMRTSAILPPRLKPLAIFHTPLGERWSSTRQHVQLLVGRCLQRAFSWKKGSPAPLELLPKADGHLCADSQHDPALAGSLSRAPYAGTALRVFPWHHVAGDQVRLRPSDPSHQAVLADGLRKPMRVLAAKNAAASSSFVKKSPLCSALGTYSTSIRISGSL